MAEAQAVQLQITNHEDRDAISYTNAPSTELQPRNYKMFWLRVATYALFALFGQTIATLLGRLYFSKGGQSKWVGTLVQLAGFPLLIPYYYFFCYSKSPPTPNDINILPKRYSKIRLLAFVYLTLGLLIAGTSYLFSIGLSYLPVSTFTLISATQLGFTSVFSFFLNSEKFTPFILNSVLLLTTSSALLVFGSSGSGVSSTGVSKGKYAIGFICTVAASAGSGLLLALTQYVLRKVIKAKTIGAVVQVMIYESLFASSVTMVGLFASGEWTGLRKEFEGFRLGKVSYVMTLFWTAISWELFTIGSVGLILEVSSIFCNVISALGLPIVQVLAVIIFHDKVDGPKVISLVLAIWGFASYIYQHYLEGYNTSRIVIHKENPNEGSNLNSSTEEVN